MWIIDTTFLMEELLEMLRQDELCIISQKRYKKTPFRMIP